VIVTEQERFEAWFERTCQSPIPNNPLAKYRTIAKELADGILTTILPKEIFVMRFEKGPVSRKEEVFRIQPKFVTEYLKRRWGSKELDWDLLRSVGYIESHESSENNLQRQVNYSLTERAYLLLDDQETTSVFISYRRAESSAFALLILSRLKSVGVNAFVDMSLQPGENWQMGIKERIQNYDVFIMVLSTMTLTSIEVLRELKWALEAGLEIIPIWHNGFHYQDTDWSSLSVEVQQVLTKTHTIRVLEESASGYNTAIVELLNRFGITPD
jgi:hypothetical protein